MRRRKRQHCWHLVDVSGRVRWASSGDGLVRCCRCGVRATRRWETVVGRAAGHGPFAEVVSSRLVSDVDGSCPGTQEQSDDNH